ncbi:MAG: hypothetical protein JO128_25360 [Alphaproteobacteria bacterium]|nr:hypothetical protein [Alphaproteobacteria bacterium]
MLALAGAESGFHADAKSRLSSAAGPFQITEPTWLHLVKSYGAAAGRPDLAKLVQQDSSGHLFVKPENASVVLDARHDIDLSSRLAARFCDECRSGLATKLGRTPTEEDVRLAYFLGVNGATRLMTAAAARPGETVRALLPSAFANHRGMFSYHGRSLDAQQALTALETRFSTQIAQTDAYKSYAGANALAERARPVTADMGPASADAAATVFSAAAEAAVEPASVVVADAAGPPDRAAADAPTIAEPPAAVQIAAAAVEKPLACKPTANGGVSCDL